MCRTADREYGGWVYRRPDGTFSYTSPLRGNQHNVNSLGEATPPHTTRVGSYHCHGDFSGNDDEEYSYDDKRTSAFGYPGLFGYSGGTHEPILSGPLGARR